MSTLLFLFLNFCFGLLPNEIDDQPKIEIRGERLAYHHTKTFLSDTFLKEASVPSREFERVIIFPDNKVRIIFISQKPGFFEINFNNMYEYNKTVSDRSLRIDYDLIDQIRETHPSQKQIQAVALKRFSQLKVLNPQLRIYDAFMKGDPTQASPLELARLGLLNAGFFRDHNFVESIRELTPEENNLHGPLEHDQRYLVKFSRIGEFVVIFKNQSEHYFSSLGEKIRINIPDVLFFKTVDNSSVFICEQILNR